MAAAEELRDRDPARRAAAARRLGTGDLAQAEALTAALLLLEDEAEAPGGAATQADDRPPSLPEDAASERASAPAATVAGAARARLTAGDLPAGASTVAAARAALEAGLAPACLVDVLETVAWSEPREAVRALAPALSSGGLPPDELARAFAAAAGGRALAELALERSDPRLLEAAGRADPAALIAALTELPPTLAWLDAVDRAITASPAAHAAGLALLARWEATEPAAAGFGALHDPEAGARFSAYLARASLVPPAAEALRSALWRRWSSVASFPLARFLARHPALNPVETIRRLGAEREPAAQAVLEALVERDPTGHAGWSALALLVRGGAHARRPAVAREVRARLARSLPSADELSALTAATLPVPGLAAALGEALLRWPDAVGLGAAFAAAALRDPEADLATLLVLVERYVLAAETAPRALQPGKLGAWEGCAGFRPQELEPLLQALADEPELRGRLIALLPTAVR